MVDISAISGLASSLKATSDIAKAMLGIRDELLITEKAIELTGAVMSAQASALSAQAAHAELVERVRALEDQLMDKEDWTREKARYRLVEPVRGIFAYEIKAGMEDGEPPHKICAHCYQERRKGLLQYEIRRPDWTEWLVCMSCKAEICTVAVQGRQVREMMDAEF